MEEDGLELWLTVLRHAKRIDEPLTKLIPSIEPLLIAGTDILPTVLRIIQSYALLDGERLIQVRCATSIFVSCAD